MLIQLIQCIHQLRLFINLYHQYHTNNITVKGKLLNHFLRSGSLHLFFINFNNICAIYNIHLMDQLNYIIHHKIKNHLHKIRSDKEQDRSKKYYQLKTNLLQN